MPFHSHIVNGALPVKATCHSPFPLPVTIAGLPVGLLPRTYSLLRPSNAADRESGERFDCVNQSGFGYPIVL